MDGIAVTKALQAALARAGLPRVTFHTFGRHGYATLMLEAGEELAVVSKVLGHANLSTTADVYAHLVPGMLERSAARMDAILGPQRDAASGGMWVRMWVRAKTMGLSDRSGRPILCTNVMVSPGGFEPPTN